VGAVEVVVLVGVQIWRPFSSEEKLTLKVWAELVVVVVVFVPFMLGEASLLEVFSSSVRAGDLLPLRWKSFAVRLVMVCCAVWDRCMEVSG